MADARMRARMQVEDECVGCTGICGKDISRWRWGCCRKGGLQWGRGMACVYDIAMGMTHTLHISPVHHRPLSHTPITNPSHTPSKYSSRSTRTLPALPAMALEILRGHTDILWTGCQGCLLRTFCDGRVDVCRGDARGDARGDSFGDSFGNALGDARGEIPLAVETRGDPLGLQPGHFLAAADLSALPG